MSLLDRVVGLLSYLLIPAVVIALSVALWLRDPPPQAAAEALSIQVLPQGGPALTPVQARLRLVALDAVAAYRTQLSERPFWIRIPLDSPAPEKAALALPSRHAREIACWDEARLEPLGQADREASHGAMQLADGGFALLLRTPLPEALLCRGRYAGPATISAELWPADALEQANREALRNAGLLEGALLGVVFLAAAFALLNRDARYLLLATWIFANLRLAGISAGWDTHWIGVPLPAAWLEPSRQLTIAAYYLLTFALFDRLFGALRLPRLLAVLLASAKALAPLLLLAAFVLPFGRFLPLMWAVVAYGITVVLACLAGLVLRPNGRVAAFYGGALLMVLAGSASEIASAAFGMDALMGVFNNVTGALASSGLAVLAFIQQLQEERHRREQAQRKLGRTYENTPIGLFTLDEAGRIQRSNAALRKMLNIPSGGPAARLASFLAPGGERALERVLAAKGHQEVEVPGHGEGNEAPWYQLRVLRTEDGIEGSLQDISERVAVTRRLRFLADHDSVTGARNRRGLEAELRAALDHSRASHPGALAYLDINRFRLINELHGFTAGDEALQQICHRIQAALPGEAVIARLSGDVFLLLFKSMPLAAAVRLCRQIQQDIAGQPVVAGGARFAVSATIGVLELTPDLSGVDAISSAERACHEAKRGEGLVVYDRNARALGERVAELRVIKSMDHGAVPAGMRLEMQPILSLNEPWESLDFEVLLRMEDAEGRSVPVSRALAAAEASGNMTRVDHWVLTQLLQWLRKHRQQLPNTRFVCINLSGISLNDSAFLDTSLQTLAEYPDVAPLLCMEITEAVALRDLRVTRNFLTRLREHGVRVALDDFGAGFTSFNYLRELEAEVLKIDGSLIRDVTAHPRNAAIVTAIVALARNLGMRTIAEWAEDAATVASLVECGADYVQGWAISPSQPPSMILQARSAADFVQDDAVRSLLQ